MSRIGQVAAVASAAAVLGVGWWIGSQDSTSTTSVSGSDETTNPTNETSASAKTTTATTSAAAGKTGSYTGSTESDRYGSITVTVKLSNGKITDVTYTSTASDGHSLGIESEAIPTLKSEAIAANAADIASVSGATYTSTKYKASLQAALDKA